MPNSNRHLRLLLFALITSVASRVALRLLLALSNLFIPIVGGDVGICTQVQNTFSYEFTTISDIYIISSSFMQARNTNLEVPITCSSRNLQATSISVINKSLVSLVVSSLSIMVYK